MRSASLQEKGLLKVFSFKTENIMHGSRLSCQVQAIAVCLYIKNLKGISLMRLHRDLKASQKKAAYLLYLLRHTNTDNVVNFMANSIRGESSRGSTMAQPGVMIRWCSTKF